MRRARGTIDVNCTQITVRRTFLLIMFYLYAL